jgi:hypothetical protein
VIIKLIIKNAYTYKLYYWHLISHDDNIMSDSDENISTQSSNNIKTNVNKKIIPESKDDDKIETLMKKEYLHPDQDDENIQHSIYKKIEYYRHKIPERGVYKNYEEIKEHRDEICGGPIKSHSYQNLLANFINPITPYKGLIVMHGLGSGKTRTGINIAENFIPQCQKYRTKIYILVPGPVLKENWKNEILSTTGEKYKKYIDKSLIVSKEENEKLEKNALSLIMQYYKFMSYKSFYKHVLGEKIIDKKVSDDGSKVKNVYRKTEDGDFERDISVDRIYNLNNSLLIVDEAHQITGNAYGDAVKYIIEHSLNLKLVLLTATPMKNLADDFVELVNFLRPQNSHMERDKIFTQHKNYMMEFKEGGPEYLRKMAMGYVSYVKGADPLTYATRVDQGEIPDKLFFTKLIGCNMKPFQNKIYESTIDDQKAELDELDEREKDGDDKRDVLDRKSESICNFVFPGLSENKKELVGYYGREGISILKNQLKENSSALNKKISEMIYGHTNELDMITLTNDGRTLTGKIFKEENLKNFSTKFHKALTNLQKLVFGEKGPKTAFIYSNLVKVGIEMFQEVLLQNGCLEYQEDEQNYQISSDTICYYCGKKYSDHNSINRKNINSDSINLDSISSESMSSESISSESMSSKSTDYNEKNHLFHPATFITITGKSSDDSIENIPEEKMGIIKNIFNNINNKHGKNIKFVLGSKVMNEGVSLRNVGEVHILDVYFNLGKVDQAVGRAIRFCSHYQLMNDKNIFPEVKVFKYVVKYQHGLSTEEELYKKAELKYILIKKVERIIKEVAIDCPLNLNGNIFHEEVEKYKNCESEGQYKCPANCDYMRCEYKCHNPKLNMEYYDPSRSIYKKIHKDKLDNTTFSHELSRNEIDIVKGIIKELYIMNYSYTLKNIIELVKSKYLDENKDLFDEFYVYKALDELIPITENDFNNFKDTIEDKHHRQGYLIYRGKFYIFQPFEQNENIPMYYRTHVHKKISTNLSIYNYLKMTDQLNNHIDIKIKKEGDDNNDDDTNVFYDFETTMDYYDSRDENNYVGFIDKEVNRRKNKSINEIDDVFKIREKRAKILEKKRATGLPSLKGAVCATAKDKGYLLKVAKKLDVPINKKIIRQDICKEIENKMLLLEKYGTAEEKNKKTYIMIPANHPNYMFPYNLEDRVSFIINKIEKYVKVNFNISTKKLKKTSGEEKGMASYLIKIVNEEKKDKNDVDLLNGIIKKYKGKETKKDKEWEILVE